MRAANTDRERTIDVLKAAYVEGRLTAAEYEQRMAAAHQAATYGQLTALVADLPAGPMVQPLAPPPPAVVAVPVMPAVPHTFLPPYPPPPPAAPQNGLAVASLTLGCLTMVTVGLTGLPAVITGHLARKRIRATGESGDSLAVVGLALGWFSVAGWALMILLMVLAAASGS
ncbi:hypothetical protein KSE_31860 [Kitasatospora setae KM-6054]|uniref:Uncharacterized protein n=2 Tax=Streptomycetaceae TaxID=2062 RepID=E4NCR5_KITSK|nr:DUF1707 and DUF4190 domain-containing protein [Kitasatospora sp. SID7827]BAJ28996.1 hypothetical protein KSE_31860 [Kitasatospora setae KM-6054]